MKKLSSAGFTFLLGASSLVLSKPLEKQPYTSAVVFGASYCDDGHPRASQYSYSLRSPPYYHGRWSNGPVWAEHVAHSLDIPLFDYAYGGATANNQLTNGGVPDTKSQIQAYIADIESGRVQRGRGKVLHLMWIGINSVNKIWHSGRGDSGVLAEVAEVKSQFKCLITDRTINSVPSEFHVMTLPPLEIVPNDVWEDEHFNNPRNALKEIQSLTETYNHHLAIAIHGLNSPLAHVHDVTNFWYHVHSNPSDFGFTHVKVACLSGSQTCTDASQYVYFDSLHPTTKMHGLVGDLVLKSLPGETSDK